MSEGISDLLAQGLLSVTKDWAKVKKQEERDSRQAERSRERYFRGYSYRVTAKEAAYAVMREAYEKASGGGCYPANARQIMYAARPAIQERTGQTLSDIYFTQVLLPDYIRENPEETAGWDVVYDARGHLSEPHTGKQIGLGTLEVREYLQDTEEPLDLDIKLPSLDGKFPTRGPRNRYSSVLYIEKEGFMTLLDRAKFAERYDLAIMSSKGMGTTAARTLIESFSETATIFVLHDFDKAGFSIVGTLSRDTRRYQYTSDVRVVDLGLRLADVKKWKLQSEAVSYSSDPTWNLRENGATAKEIAFLCEKRGWRPYRGKRVELNAFTSDQFVDWLDFKLTKHGVEKVIPNKKTLEQAYRRAAAVRRYQESLDSAEEEISTYAEGLKLPGDLRKQLAKMLSEDPALPWDKALAQLVEDEDEAEDQ